MRRSDKTVVNFTPTNELERLLLQAARDPAVRPHFYHTLLDSQLFVLVPPNTGPHGERTLAKNENVSLVTWKNGEKNIVPMFTSLSLLQQTIKPAGQTTDYLSLKGKDLFGMLGNGTIPAVLNPNCPAGKEFLVQEMHDLASGKFFEPATPQVVEKQRKILLGQPAEYPHQLVEILTRCLSSQPQVEAAYLAQIADPAAGVPPHLIFSIKIQGDIDPVMHQLVMITRESVGPNKIVDFTVFGRGGGLDDYFLKQTRPFYQRQTVAGTGAAPG